MPVSGVNSSAAASVSVAVPMVKCVCVFGMVGVRTSGGVRSFRRVPIVAVTSGFCEELSKWRST